MARAPAISDVTVRTMTARMLGGVLLVWAVLACTPSAAATARLQVVPIIFLPADHGDISAADQSHYTATLRRHLELAQQHWRTVLGTDTFAISPHGAVYRGRQPHAFYNPTGNREDGSEGLGRLVIDLFAWQRDNRVDSRLIYLIVYARPPGAPGPQIGGGRPFNGKPGSGGGAAALELSSLVSDKPYPFQSTLVHELGHTFGLTHPNCFGYDIATNTSIMSYNLRHHTRGLAPAAEFAGLNPEEYFILARNPLAFPDFRYVEALHNPRRKPIQGVERCYLGPMTTQIGVDEQRKLEGVGYELFFDGKRVSGPDAPFMSRPQGVANCAWNRSDKKGRVRVDCRYNGLPL
jgi:hypothetical protein